MSFDQTYNQPFGRAQEQGWAHPQNYHQYIEPGEYDRTPIYVTKPVRKRLNPAFLGRQSMGKAQEGINKTVDRHLHMKQRTNIEDLVLNREHDPALVGLRSGIGFRKF